jgi:hypothetical protein
MLLLGVKEVMARCATYPGGQIAYDVREGTVPNRGRVLLIYRP